MARIHQLAARGEVGTLGGSAALTIHPQGMRRPPSMRPSMYMALRRAGIRSQEAKKIAEWAAPDRPSAPPEEERLHWTEVGEEADE